MAVPSESTRQEKILVVEDDEFSQQVIQLYLKKAGFERVKSALDGRAGLDLIRAETFDLVLLDLNLPRMNGTELLHRLKADGTVRRTPIIAITSLANVEETKAALDLGAADYLPKPFNTRLLQDRIDACLEKHRLARLLESETKRAADLLDAAAKLQRMWVRTARTDRSAALLAPDSAPSGGFFDVMALAGGRLGFAIGHVGGGDALKAALAREEARLLLATQFDAGSLAQTLGDGNFAGGVIEADGRLSGWSAQGAVIRFDIQARSWLIVAEDPLQPISLPAPVAAVGSDPATLLATYRGQILDRSTSMAMLALTV